MMRTIRYVTLLLTTTCVLALALVAAREEAEAGTAATAQDKEASIRANLAKLPDKDRKLAEAQKYCAVDTDDRLGAMGVPVKILIQDQAVFLCCKSCIDQAQKNPEKTLARVKELQAKAKAEDKK
jgi:hypothetical protein